MIASPLVDVVSLLSSVFGVVAIIGALAAFSELLQRLLDSLARIAGFRTERRLRSAQLEAAELRAQAARLEAEAERLDVTSRAFQAPVDDESFHVDPDDPRDVARLIDRLERARNARREATDGTSLAE